METIIETTETIVINSLQEIYDLAGSHQITGQELFNQRTYIDGKGWTAIKLTYEFKQWLANEIAIRLGGRYNTINDVRRALMGVHPPQHWGLQRFLVADYGKGAYISYCAGQDQTWESNQIRKYLRKV